MDWLDRVVQEYEDLKKKHEKLEKFLKERMTDLDGVQAYLMRNQLKTIRDYLNILSCRIEHEHIKRGDM